MLHCGWIPVRETSVGSGYICVSALIRAPTIRCWRPSNVEQNYNHVPSRGVKSDFALLSRMRVEQKGDRSYLKPACVCQQQDTTWVSCRRIPFHDTKLRSQHTFSRLIVHVHGNCGLAWEGGHALFFYAINPRTGHPVGGHPRGIRWTQRMKERRRRVYHGTRSGGRSTHCNLAKGSWQPCEFGCKNVKGGPLHSKVRAPMASAVWTSWTVCSSPWFSPVYDQPSYSPRGDDWANTPKRFLGCVQFSKFCMPYEFESSGTLSARDRSPNNIWCGSSEGWTPAQSALPEFSHRCGRYSRIPASGFHSELGGADVAPVVEDLVSSWLREHSWFEILL